MFKDLKVFLESFKLKTCFDKYQENLILVSKNIMTPISIRNNARNVLIQEKKKTETSFLLVVRLINKDKIDRIGLLFEKESDNIFLTFLPYYVSECYSFSINGIILIISNNKIEFKTIIKNEKASILLCNSNFKYLLDFKFIINI